MTKHTTTTTNTRRTVQKDGPHPVDVTIGQRIRAVRNLRGMTQEQLASATGCTFQQIQKYERGFNRVSGSRLVMIGTALDTPASYWLSGINLDGTETAATDNLAEAIQANGDTHIPNLSVSALRLVHMIDRMPEGTRSAVEKLVRSVSHPKIALEAAE